MFWKLPTLSASSPVEAILDKENFTLEELLDEEEVIQECKALNSRLINFLRDRAQVEQLVHYIVEEPAEDADSKRAFKFPFIACEVFTCEIDVILKTLVQEKELMDMLFSFLNPDRPHSALLAGYFSKVVACLMLRKTVVLMNYVQAHQDILCRLVDLIGITSIMEVLVRLVGADDHVYPNFLDVMQWLADSNLLEMIVDKLSPSAPPEVHCNAAEILCAITRNAPSALATKLSSTSFVERVLGHGLEESCSKSGLVNSLSVCISLLDPRRTTASSSLFHSYRSQHMYECPVPVNPETINAMLPRLGDLLVLLNVSSNENILPTTYGELRPPLGKHRLKVVEFIAVLMKSGSEAAEKELISSGTILRILDLFFEYPYNNALHHHVESIIISCLESRNDLLAEHLFCDCCLIEKMLRTDRSPNLSNDFNQPTLPTVGKYKPRAGNIGHITRISKKINQVGSINSLIQRFLQENSEWSEWQATVLQGRIAIENVLRWACGKLLSLTTVQTSKRTFATIAVLTSMIILSAAYSYFTPQMRVFSKQCRPTALLDRAKDSDEDDIYDRDYDVAALANSLSQAFTYNMYGNEDAEEDRGPLDRDDEDVYFDEESAEVVLSSLRLGDDQGSLFTNSNWFAFQDDRRRNSCLDTSSSEMLGDTNLNGRVAAGGENSSSDDEVVVGEDMDENHEIEKKSTSKNNTSTSSSVSEDTKSSTPFEIPENEADMPLPEWVGWGESSDALQIGGSSVNPFIEDPDMGDDESLYPNATPSIVTIVPDVSSDSRHRLTNSVPSLFEDDVEFIGVEAEGTEKAMDHALKEGIVGEAGPLKRNLVPNLPDSENTSEADAVDVQEFNDTNYWRIDHEVPVLE